MDDIKNVAVKCWRERLEACLTENGYTQKSFAKAIGSTQANVSRWMRVGDTVINKKTKQKSEIGFPEFETMTRIAEFFNVSVGYLTGETDYETFDLERACTYLHISEDAGKSIEQITKGTYAFTLDRLLKKEYRAALCYLLTAENLKNFIYEMCSYAKAIKLQKHPVKHLDIACQKIKPEILDIALAYRNCMIEEEMDSKLDSPKVQEAIKLLEEAESKDFAQFIDIEQKVKLSKYTLYEEYIKLVDEIVCDEHLDAMTARLMISYPSIAEMRHQIENDAD